jgi:aryl-alcohol dehydrogenase-like predicted oxidoreductase
VSRCRSRSVPATTWSAPLSTRVVDWSSRGFNQWSLDEEASQPFFRQAVDLGITFWDTANVYQLGSSEEFVGRAIKKHSRREDIVLATKVSGKMHDGPGGQGCRARRSWSRSMLPSPGWARITSICT